MKKRHQNNINEIEIKTNADNRDQVQTANIYPQVRCVTSRDTETPVKDFKKRSRNIFEFKNKSSKVLSFCDQQKQNLLTKQNLGSKNSLHSHAYSHSNFGSTDYSESQQPKSISKQAVTGGENETFTSASRKILNKGLSIFNNAVQLMQPKAQAANFQKSSTMKLNNDANPYQLGTYTRQYTTPVGILKNKIQPVKEDKADLFRHQEEKIAIAANKKIMIESEREIKRSQQMDEQYEEEFGLASIRVCFLLKDPKNYLDLNGTDFKKKMHVYYDYPKLQCIPENLAIVRVKGQEFFCIGGDLHNSLKEAYTSVLKNHSKREVDISVQMVDKTTSFDVCMKLKYDIVSCKIYVQLRRIKSLEYHKFEKDCNRGLMSKTQPMKQSKYLDVITKSQLRGPYIKCSSNIVWKFQENHEEIKDPKLISLLHESYSQAKELGQDQITWVDSDNGKFILACEVGQTPYILNSEKHVRQLVERQSKGQLFWDFLDTFKPPASVSIYSDKQFYQILKLDPISMEYQYVALKWASSYIDPSTSSPTTVTIKKTLKMLSSVKALPASSKIACIYKVLNSNQYDLLQKEMQRMLLKYKTHKLDTLAQHLFLGSSINPKLIYSSKEGLQNKLSSQEDSNFYLTNNSLTVDQNTFRKDELKYVFLCLALTPPTITNHKKNSQSEIIQLQRSETFSSGQSSTPNEKEKSLFILNENITVYPGYLITYK